MITAQYRDSLHCMARHLKCIVLLSQDRHRTDRVGYNQVTFYQDRAMERKWVEDSSKGIVKWLQWCTTSSNLGETGTRIIWGEEWLWKCIELMGILEQKRSKNKTVKIECCHQGVESLKWRHFLAGQLLKMIISRLWSDHGLGADNGKDH